LAATQASGFYARDPVERQATIWLLISRAAPLSKIFASISEGRLPNQSEPEVRNVWISEPSCPYSAVLAAWPVKAEIDFARCIDKRRKVAMDLGYKPMFLFHAYVAASPKNELAVLRRADSVRKTDAQTAQ
jgi:hypothetical protein